MTGNFNADAFMQTEVEGEFETEFTPIPEDEYRALIKDVTAGTTPNKGTPYLEVTWIVDDDGVRELLGLDEPTVRQTIWLDVNESGSLEFGKNKNIGLGRLRDALGQNSGGAWGPSMLLGQVATVNIKHDITDQGGVFARVKGVRA
jgi:hypothetical protein